MNLITSIWLITHDRNQWKYSTRFWLRTIAINVKYKDNIYLRSDVCDEVFAVSCRIPVRLWGPADTERNLCSMVERKGAMLRDREKAECMIRQRNLNGSNESIGLRYDMYAVGRQINLAWLWLVFGLFGRWGGGSREKVGRLPIIISAYSI